MNLTYFRPKNKR